MKNRQPVRVTGTADREKRMKRDAVTRKAYAKINLSLDVTGRREDGYHLLSSVMQTIGNRADSHIFAMSEFQLHEAVIDEAESPYYLQPDVKVAFDALQAELQTMRMRIGAGTASANDCETLRQAIEAAEQALENATGIKAVRDSGFSILNEKADIFDLQGRRIINGRWLLNNGQLPKGVYIVNGKKVLF